MIEIEFASSVVKLDVFVAEITTSDKRYRPVVSVVCTVVTCVKENLLKNTANRKMYFISSTEVTPLSKSCK
jgi:hypothetical protein